MLALPDLSLRFGNFFPAAADVHRPRLPACCCLERDRPVQSQVQFKHTRPIAIFFYSSPVTNRQFRTGYFQDLIWGKIKQYRFGRRKLRIMVNLLIQPEFNSQGFCLRFQSLGNSHGTTPGKRPAKGVTGNTQHQTDAGSYFSFQR